jgi:hypothetical protein
MPRFISTMALLWAALAGTAHGALTPEQVKALPPAADRKVNFARDIKPIFEASCIKCHGRGRAKGDLQIDSRETLLKGGESGPVIVPGASEKSLLVHLVSGIDPDNIMPQKGSRLTPEQVGLVRAWIDQGAPWDAEISFARAKPRNLEPRVPELPEGLEKDGRVEDRGSRLESWRYVIDRILESYYRSNRFEIPELVSDRVYARRVYLDVLGLLPPADELQSFVDDKAPEKRARLVRRLLKQNEDYAQHWLTFWNDLLRNDYRGTGYIDGGRKQVTGWLYAALSTNMPYDQFVAKLISPTPETEGFTRGIVWRGVVNASQTPAMQAAQNISQVFMGVNLKCASCHDSFINDWRLSDSYGLASIYSDAPLEMFQCDKPTGKMSKPAFIYPELGELDPAADKLARLKRLAEIITGPRDGRLSRTIVNRLWGRFFGRALVEPVDDMEQAPWNQDLLDWLAQDLTNHGYDLKHTIEVILTSQAYQLPAINLSETSAKDYVFRGPALRRMTAEQFRDAIGQLSGAWHAKASFGSSTNRVRTSFVPADPLTTALGRPNRDVVTTCRASTATTLQALELTNGETLADALERGAANLSRTNSDPEKLIQIIFTSALGRPPTPDEFRLASAVVGAEAKKEAVEDVLWAVAMLPEFQLIY